MRYIAIALLSIGLTSGAFAVDVEVSADANVGRGDLNLSYFYENLSPHGKWSEAKDLGWVWQPSVEVENTEWRPYRDQGHWVYTDDGWYWQSEYEWGWAPFHYGRWTIIENNQWVWVPGTTWGPAWVTWRESGDNFGWAPLPPGAEFREGVGFEFNHGRVGFDADFGLGENFFTFVPSGHFLDENIVSVTLSTRDRENIFRSSKVVNNSYTVNNNRVVNNGVPVQRVSQAAHKEIKPVQVATANSPKDVTKGQAAGNQIHAFRPQIKNEAPKDPKAFANGAGNTNAKPNAAETAKERENNAARDTNSRSELQQRERQQNAQHPVETTADKNATQQPNAPRSTDRERQRNEPAKQPENANPAQRNAEPQRNASEERKAEPNKTEAPANRAEPAKREAAPEPKAAEPKREAAPQPKAEPAREPAEQRHEAAKPEPRAEKPEAPDRKNEDPAKKDGK